MLIMLSLYIYIEISIGGQNLVRTLYKALLYFTPFTVYYFNLLPSSFRILRTDLNEQNRFKSIPGYGY